MWAEVRFDSICASDRLMNHKIESSFELTFWWMKWSWICLNLRSSDHMIEPECDRDLGPYLSKQANRAKRDIKWDISRDNKMLNLFWVLPKVLWKTWSTHRVHTFLLYFYIRLNFLLRLCRTTQNCYGFRSKRWTQQTCYCLRRWRQPTMAWHLGQTVYCLTFYGRTDHLEPLFAWLNIGTDSQPNWYFLIN